MAWFHAYLANHEKFHVVILVFVCWPIWNMRNRITFDKYILKSPSVISFYSISLLAGHVFKKMFLLRRNRQKALTNWSRWMPHKSSSSWCWCWRATAGCDHHHLKISPWQSASWILCCWSLMLGFSIV
jgi:hypothetical protein